MTEKKYKAVLIGCGKIGIEIGNFSKEVQPGTHAGAFESNKRISFIAVADKDISRLSIAKNNFPKVNVYSDPELMIKQEQPDIVSIATPTKFHYENVVMVAKYKPRLILCEKPIAYTDQEAEKMVKICKKNNVILIINHQRRFDPILNKWAIKIKTGFLGELYQGNMYYYNGLFNNGTHAIDLMMNFLGNPVSVVGYYNKKTSINEDQNIDGTIIFENNINISLQSLNKNYGHFCFSLFGDQGMLNITKASLVVEYRKKEENQQYQGFYQLSDKIQKEGEPRSMLASVVGHVVDVLDGRAKPISTGEDGREVINALLALKQSADLNGKTVFVNFHKRP